MKKPPAEKPQQGSCFLSGHGLNLGGKTRFDAGSHIVIQSPDGVLSGGSESPVEPFLPSGRSDQMSSEIPVASADALLHAHDLTFFGFAHRQAVRRKMGPDRRRFLEGKRPSFNAFSDRITRAAQLRPVAGGRFRGPAPEKWRWVRDLRAEFGFNPGLTLNPRADDVTQEKIPAPPPPIPAPSGCRRALFLVQAPDRWAT